MKSIKLKCKFPLSSRGPRMLHLLDPHAALAACLSIHYPVRASRQPSCESDRIITISRCLWNAYSLPGTMLPALRNPKKKRSSGMGTTQQHLSFVFSSPPKKF